MGNCKSNYTHSCYSTNDNSCDEFCWGNRFVTKSNYFYVSLFFSSCCRNGKRFEITRPDSARSNEDMVCILKGNPMVFEVSIFFTLSFCFIKSRSCCFAGWGHSWRTSFGCYCRFGGQNASRHLLWSDNYDLERFVCCCFSCCIFSFYNRFLTKNHA